MKKPIAIDLFSGCGGLTLGLKQAGFRVRAAVEIDPLAVETYKKNHPRIRVWQEDITKLAAASVMQTLNMEAGDLDLLAGCPPCQGFSTIPTLNGRRRPRDSRNDLIFEFLRFVRVMRPKAVMMENVPGLAKNRRLKTLKKELRRLGYKCNSAVLNAADFGVPQRRRRFILLGTQNVKPKFANHARRRKTVREALGRLGARSARDALHIFPQSRSEKVLNMIRRIPKDGGSRLDLGLSAQLECHKDSNGFKDVYGRMAWDEVAPTITGGCCNPSKGRFLHPTKNRCITLREAALLQSFPPAYFFSVRRGKFATAQMIGNALPPEFIRRHAIALRRSALEI